MLSQCDGVNKFVIADTMDLWITIANEQLHVVLSKIDLLVLNESEARELARTSNLILAGEILLEKGPKHVIIKLGEFGAVLFGPDDKMFRLHAWPLKEVADPTGAGDSFLGGMAGYLDNLETDQFSFDDICQSMARGSVAASYTCEAFSTLRLQEITKEDLSNRLGALRELGHW
jgi:sugar/nucleoside kinase (ribokinase family)